jgi:hypothetical protein
VWGFSWAGIFCTRWVTPLLTHWFGSLAHTQSLAGCSGITEHRLNLFAGVLEFLLTLKHFQNICNISLQHHARLHDLVQDPMDLRRHCASIPTGGVPQGQWAAICAGYHHLVHVKYKVQLAHVLEAAVQSFNKHLDQI